MSPKTRNTLLVTAILIAACLVFALTWSGSSQTEEPPAPSSRWRQPPDPKSVSVTPAETTARRPAPPTPMTDTAPAGEAPTTTGIEVQVRTTAGTPVPGAIVRADDSSGSTWFRTNELGQALLEGVYRDLAVTAPGLAAGEWRSSDLPTQQPWILVLEAAATLQVRVTDDRGFFVPGALIEAVVDDKVIRGGRRLAARSRAYTGEDGIARFDDLGDASYDLQFIPFRRWRSADAYGVAAIVGSPGWHELETRSEPDARCLELEVEGLDKLPLERWTRSDLALEVQSDSALLSIFRDGRATLVDQPGRQVHVRMVTVEGGHPLPNGPRSDWRLGIVGQTRALLLEAPQRAQ